MEVFVCYRSLSFGHSCLVCFKVMSTISPRKSFCLAPALDGIELAMKLRIKQNTVAQCFNLFLQASFLILKVPLYLKNSASTAAALRVAAWSTV